MDRNDDERSDGVRTEGNGRNRAVVSTAESDADADADNNDDNEETETTSESCVTTTEETETVGGTATAEDRIAAKHAAFSEKAKPSDAEEESDVTKESDGTKVARDDSRSEDRIRAKLFASPTSKVPSRSASKAAASSSAEDRIAAKHAAFSAKANPSGAKEKSDETNENDGGNLAARDDSRSEDRIRAKLSAFSTAKVPSKSAVTTDSRTATRSNDAPSVVTDPSDVRTQSMREKVASFYEASKRDLERERPEPRNAEQQSLRTSSRSRTTRTNSSRNGPIPSDRRLLPPRSSSREMSVMDVTSNPELYASARFAKESPTERKNGYDCGEFKEAFKARNVLVTVLIVLVVVLPVSILLSKRTSDKNNNDDGDGGSSLRNELLSANLVSEDELNDPESVPSRAYERAKGSNGDVETYLSIAVAYGIGADDVVPDADVDVDRCEWAWVDCDDEGRTVGIVLGDAVGDGGATVPSELASFPRLERLDLSKNGLRGEVPAFLTGAGRLSWLDLSDNDLTGVVPDDLWTNATGLVHLDLSVNLNLRTSLSPIVTRATSLRHLALASCDVGGTLPTELGSLSDLEWLYLGSNRDLAGTIPTELGGLTSLKAVSLSLCGGVKGPIPPRIFSPAIELIWLNGNDLTGTIPTEIGSASSLQLIALGVNPLHGTIPTEIVGNEKLRVFGARSTDVGGRIPTEIGRLRELEFLDLENTYVTGTIPEELGNLTRMETLQLCGTSVEGTVPEGTCENNRKLELYYGDFEEKKMCSCCVKCTT